MTTIADSTLRLLEKSTASWMFVEYVRRYPDTILASSIQEDFELGILNEKNVGRYYHHFGGFGAALFHGDLDEALGFADSYNQTRLQELLSDDATDVSSCEEIQRGKPELRR
jgi:hypothetical protein